MKRLITMSLGAMLCASASAQLTVTQGGKEIKELKCDMEDVHLSFVLPSNYKSYEKIEVALRKNAPENNASDPNLYGVVWSSGYFDGKKTIEVDLVNESGGSDFYRGMLEFNLDDPCYDPMRSYTYLEDVFYINGAVHDGWEYQNGKQVKTYRWETIKEYKVKHSIGPVLDFYYGPDQKFTFDKIEEEEVELANYNGKTMLGKFKKAEKSTGNNAFDMSGAAPKPTSGEIKFVAEIVEASEYSIDECMKGVEFNLVRSSNESFVINGFAIPFDHQHTFNVEHVYLPVTPEGAQGGKKEEEPKSGGLSKLKKFAGQFTSSQKGGSLSKSENEELANKIAQNSNDYFNWSDAKLGNLSVKKLEIEVYEGSQVSSNDAWATYVKDDEVGKTRKLLIYIGQSGEDIFCVAMYKKDHEGLTPEETKFISNVESTFKVL
ncbi:hypothetical protein [Parvicella tangerina]|uniref:Uncharacterized protein n=1 Tax=Parvicella tangerina TaxID=2829795 RepID=A0A916NPB5_9FLAO|nr:hypothetical protein [Parvicella tangerina]CAG5076320.1 hypothetical protein CRYO30217_00064 [Parvicella tangerina]